MEKCSFLPFIGWKLRHGDTKGSNTSENTGPIRTRLQNRDLQTHTFKCSWKPTESLRKSLSPMLGAIIIPSAHQRAGNIPNEKVDAQDRKKIGCSEIMKASLVRESHLGEWGISTLFILTNRPLWTMQKSPGFLPQHQQHTGQHESTGIF